MADRDTCKGCGAEMLWALTKEGRRVPLDAKQTTICTVGSDGVVEYHRGHVPHHITCPNAAQFKRR